MKIFGGGRLAVLLLLAFLAGACGACAARVDPDVAQGFGAVQKNDFSSAVAAYTRALDSGRLSPEQRAEVLSWRGHACALAGDQAQAEADLTQVVELKPDAPDPLVKRGLYRAGQGRLEAAAEDLQRAVALAPDNPVAAMYLGNVLRDLGRFDAALAQYDRVLLLAPRMTPALLGRAVTLKDMGRQKEALAVFDQLAVREPDCGPCYMRRGEIMVDMGLPEAARRDFDRALRLDPRMVEALLDRGRLRLSRKDFVGAEADASQAIALAPDLGEAFELRAAARRELNRDAEARADAARAVALGRPAGPVVPIVPPMVDTRESGLSEARDPARAARELATGQSLAGKREWARAAAAFSRAVELDPDNLAAYEARAVAQENLGRPELAQADYTQVIERAPGSVQAAKALAARAALKANCADFTGARSDLEAALAIDTGSVTVLSDLTWLLAVCPEADLRDGHRAVDLGEKAVALHGRRDPGTLARLAAAYAEAGEFRPAARLARQAADMLSARGERGSLAQVRDQLALYEQGRAFHLPPGQPMF